MTRGITFRGLLDGTSQRRFRYWGEIKELAASNKAYCDYDHTEPVRLRGVWALARTLGSRISYVRYDRTKRGWHAVICFNRSFSPAEIVAVQAVLGSDYKREALNLSRVISCTSRAGMKRWNLLYRVKLES